MRKPNLNDVLAADAGQPPQDVDPEELARYTALAKQWWGDVEPAFRAVISAPYRQVADWHANGDPRADWLIAFLPAFEEHERIAALRRILSRLDGPPIYAVRWERNREELCAAMEDLGTTSSELAHGPSGWRAVAELVGRLSVAEIGEADVARLRKLRTALDRLICEDLLGPGWRRHARRERDLSKAAAQLGPAADDAAHAAEIDALVSAYTAGAGLTAAEAALWEAYNDCGDWPEAYDALGITDVAGRQRKLGLLKKLQPLRLALTRISRS